MEEEKAMSVAAATERRQEADSEEMSPREPARLTKREREVIECLREGLTADEIAERLYLSKRTVNLHTDHIYRKLGVNNRFQAVALLRRGAVRVESGQDRHTGAL